MLPFSANSNSVYKTVDYLLNEVLMKYFSPNNY